MVIKDTEDERVSDRIERLIADARRKFPQLFPEQNFDSQVWDCRDLKSRTNTGQATKLAFIKFPSTASVDRNFPLNPVNALPKHVADVVKAWLIHDDNFSSSGNYNRLTAVRYFWDFLQIKRPEVADSFEWTSLSENDFLAFELFLMSNDTRISRPLAANTTCSIISSMQVLADFLTARGICRRIRYNPQTVLYVDSASLCEKRRVAEERLPPPGVLEALADIYYRMTTAPEGTVSDWELILISGVVVEMLTGLRIGELVTLPYDCEVEEIVSDVLSGRHDGVRYGIRYWVEKTGSKTARIKWVSPTAEPIVRAAIALIKRLTAEARERARVLEAGAGQVPLPPEFAEHTVLTREEVLSLLGNTCECSVMRKVRPGHDITPSAQQKAFYHRDDVESYFVSRRVKHLHTLLHEDGSVQKLSESLFIAFVNQSKFWYTGPCKMLVEPITVGAFKRFLSPQKGRRTLTVFARHGTTEEQRLLSANTHSFRHWLNHIAYKGKMSVDLITRYFSRTNPISTRSYLHYSPEEVGGYVREEIRAGRVFGPVAATYWSLPPDLREDFLLGQVMVGHFTPWGICTRNLSVQPCEKHINCLNDCVHFCSTKGDVGQVAALLDLQRKTGWLLKQALRAQERREAWAPEYIEYHERTLRKIRVVLAKHLDGTVEDGVIVQPFEGGTSHFQIQS